jgi:exonuclease III
MRGWYNRGTDKWSHVNQIMREKKIGILALQETHIGQVEVEDIHTWFGECLQIYHTIDPTQPNSKGVAIVLNKNITNIIGVQEFKIMPGRAIMVKIPWHRDKMVTALAIYAPNDGSHNTELGRTRQ